MDVSRQNPAAERAKHRLRRLLVLVTGFLLAVAGVLVPVGVEAAPRFNLPCDELFGESFGDAVDDDLPGGKNLQHGNVRPIGDYTYENPAEAFRGRQAPTPQELEALQGDYKQYPAASEEHMLRRWKHYQEKENRKSDWSWDRWRDQYIPNMANDTRGDGYARVVARNLRLGGSGWICEDNQLQAEKNLGYERRYDAVNREKKVAYELKSGTSRLKLEQLRADQRLMQGSGYKVYYVFSQEPPPGRIQLMRQYGVGYVVLKSNLVLRNPTANPGSTAMNPDPNKPTGGSAKEIAQRSGKNPADAEEVRRVFKDQSNDSRRGASFGARRPGGIDWTSLELHYVSDDPTTQDFGYAFSAGELPEAAEEDEEAGEPSYGGEAALDLSSDALFTWLALDPDQFWVNLNPDTPETIIDPQFATTDAGRVLLEADLRFKEVQSEYMDPDTDFGKAFWDSMERTSDGLLCHGSIADTFAPLLEERVNTGPEYADLRRVYTSRVAAQWLKERDAERPGAFHDVIGSGDVSAWPARTPWDPQDVYGEYLEQLSTPLFRYEYTIGEAEYYLDIMGGVMLPDTPRDAMPAEQFAQEHPTLPETVRSSVHDAVSVPLDAPAAAGDAIGTFADGVESMAWLGGGPIVQLAPEPEPTDPPAPGPGDPGPGDPGPGDPGPGDPGVPPGGPGGGPGSGPRGGSPRQDLAWGGSTLPRTGFSEPWLLPTAFGLILVGSVLLALRHRRPHRE